MRARWAPWGWRTLGLLVTLAVPVLLTTASVRWAFNDLRLYLYGFRRYGVSEDTGIPWEDLEKVARSIRDYFNDDRAWLLVTARVEGEERLLFNQRELLHMRDVKALVRGVYRVQEGSLALIVLASLVAVLLEGRQGLRRVLGWLKRGGLLTVGLVLAVGVGVVVAFPWLFYLFHLLAFRNPYWMLDPRRDYLIRLFPQGFWFDATLFVTLSTLAGGLLLALLGWLGHRRLSRRLPGAV